MRFPAIKTALAILFFLLPAFSAAAHDPFAPEFLLTRIDAPAAHNLLAHAIQPLPQRVAQEEARPETPPPRVRVESNESLTALNFNHTGVFSPYLGAGIGHEEPPIHEPGQPLNLMLRLGAGFGCNLDAITRIFFNYTFQFLPDAPSDSTSRLDDTHHITLGLQFAF